MRSIEKTAKTYEEALESALKELNASITDVDVLTLEEGSKGLFGLFGSRPYKIRVTLKAAEAAAEDELDVKSLLAPKKPEPARKPERAERPAKPEKAEKTEKAEKSEQTEEKKAARRPEPVRRVNPDRKPAGEADKPAEEPEAPEAEAPETEEPAGEGAAEPKKRRRRHRGRGGSRRAEGAPEGAEAEDKPAKLPPKPVTNPLEKPVVTMIAAEELDPESAAGRAKAFLQELTRLMGVDVTVEVGTDPEGNVFGYMNGDPLGILIGRRGETLDALQYLTSLWVNRNQEGYTRVTLDTENYRAKREDTLIRLANRKANHAIKTGRRVALDPMNPYERRIIHGALQANEAVETHSEGEEPGRHVVITVRKA